MRSPETSGLLSPGERRQRQVLDLLLDEHPGQLSIDEVITALAEDPTDFALADDVRVAIRDLIAYGLVHRHDEFVFASRPAVRLWWLDP